jgi:hypothetical protein
MKGYSISYLICYMSFRSESIIFRPQRNLGVTEGIYTGHNGTNRIGGERRIINLDTF